MARELFLHIGAHKTGTTTIQRSLAGQPEALAAQGACFVTANNRPSLHGLLGPRDMDLFPARGFELLRPKRLRELIAEAPQPRIIGSSENFSFFFDADAIRALARALRLWRLRVRVVVYLRRQDSHVVSHHQEGAKIRRRAEEQLFGHALSAIPGQAPELDRYLDYNHRIGLWLDAFGAENVVVRRYDPAHLVGGDVWLDFLQVVGLSPEGLPMLGRRNVSQGLTRARLGHMMNGRGTSEDLHRLVSRALPEDDRQRPARAEAMRFYERYRAGNAALAARLGLQEPLFSEAFDSYPEVAQEDWTPASAEAALRALQGCRARWQALLPEAGLRACADLARAAGRPGLEQAFAQLAAEPPGDPAPQGALDTADRDTADWDAALAAELARLEAQERRLGAGPLRRAAELAEAAGRADLAVPLAQLALDLRPGDAALAALRARLVGQTP